MQQQKHKDFGGGPGASTNDSKFQKLKKPEVDMARLEKAQAQAKKYEEASSRYRDPDDSCVC
jgi:hypothetical protein